MQKQGIQSELDSATAQREELRLEMQSAKEEHAALVAQLKQDIAHWKQQCSSDKDIWESEREELKGRLQEEQEGAQGLREELRRLSEVRRHVLRGESDLL